MCKYSRFVGSHALWSERPEDAGCVSAQWNAHGVRYWKDERCRGGPNLSPRLRRVLHMEALSIVQLTASDAFWVLESRSPTLRLSMDHEAEFELLFVEHFDGLVRSVSAITGNAELASDAVQEAFIKAYARWSRIRRYDDPVIWIRRVAINKSRDTHRSFLRRRSREDRVGRPRAVTASAADAVDSHLDLASTFAQLPTKQRTVASLFYLEDVPIAEIANTMKISEGTVKFHLNKARASLAPLLQAEDGAA